MDGSKRSDDEELPSDSDSFLRAVAAAPEQRLPSPDASSESLERVGRFSIREPIGQGGMGIVFRAEDEKLRRVVALKVLPRSFGDDDKRRRRFMREARLAASISHPNVATVHEVGEVDGRIYIAMELVSGTTLRHKLEDGPLPLELARQIAIEIARGVGKAHERGIAHRDLKPDNVMVSADGAIKVLDFGLAKPTDDEQPHQAGDSATLTKEGGIVGTPGYMSPEQATGRPLDVRTDVFSLGVLLYEMVTGTRPFKGETSMDKLIATSRDDHVPASQVNRRVPPSLEHVIDRCLAKEPSERFATAAELASALEAVDLEAAVVAQTKARGAWRSTRWLAGAGVAVIGMAAAWALSRGASSTAATSDQPEVVEGAPVATVTVSTHVLVATPPASGATTTAPTEAPSPRVVVMTTTTAAHPRVTVALAASAPAPTASARPAASSPTPPDVSASSRGGVIQSSPY